MTEAEKTIKDLYAHGSLQVCDVTFARANTYSSNWIQYKMRMAATGQKDDVYYEIEEVAGGLRAQLHVRSKTSRMQTALRENVCRIADNKGFAHTRKTSKDFRVFVTSVRQNDENVLVGLCDDLHELFVVFEKELCGYVQCGVLKDETKVKSSNRERVVEDREANDIPWYVNWKLDGECLNETFDADLKRLKGLKWLPWIGDQYESSRILVVGESNYADSDWVSVVERDIDFTRKVSDYLCIKREEKQKGRTLPTIARMLRREDDEDVRDVWRRIGYMDIVQRCLTDYGDRKERPQIEDLKSGFRCVSKVIDVLKPRLVIFSGSNSVLDVVPELKVGCSKMCPKRNESGHAHAMIGKVPVLLLPHPVSFGFSHYEWRKFLRESFPAFFHREKSHA